VLEEERQEICPESRKKRPFNLCRYVYHFFFSFSSLCCKDEIQVTQINAERNKNESMIAGDALSYFFLKGGLRTECNCAFTFE